jgi:ferredoxin-type protein NapH
MAVVLKDNRAFCKYFCPIVVFFKIGARYSLLKVKEINKGCNNCQACEKNCPMDIRITEYIKNNQRVSSTECIICQTCISTRLRKVLGLSYGFDRSKGEFLNRIKNMEKVTIRLDSL